MRASSLAAIALLVPTVVQPFSAQAETVSPQAVGCKAIRNAAQLQAIQNNLAGTYCLAKDIDASSIANFTPIGNDTTPFTGKLFGNGWVIRNLTINGGLRAGLFGAAVYGALIQDVGLENVNIVSTVPDASVGGLVSYILGNGGLSTEIRRVHVTGRIVGPNGGFAGGIAGVADTVTVTDSWSSANVSKGYYTGGAIGYAYGAAITRVYATGQVTCTDCYAGGLIGFGESINMTLSHAAGAVTAREFSTVGGLAGDSVTSTIRRSHALGPVTAAEGSVGGLIGHVYGGTLAEVYAAGRVTADAGASVGGLIGGIEGTTAISHAYWDVNTSKQPTSSAGTGYTTKQLRAALPPGFGNAWAITAKRSYPFLNEADIDFTAPLATLVQGSMVYTFLPIGQHDQSQYAAAPAAPDALSLAAVYAMIARGIGVTRDIAALKTVRINRFWNNTKKVAVWRGQAATLATLGAFKTIPTNVRINKSNVIGEIMAGRPVILRGAYTRSNGAKAEHWLLATLYATSGNALAGLIANDPWTGLQVTIDPATKKVLWPANHPLAGFKIDGYRAVTLN